MGEYRWCGLLDRRHDVMVCERVRDDKKGTRERCKYLIDDVGCTFLTNEEKVARVKAHNEVEEEEVKKDETTHNDNVNGSTGESDS